MITKWFQFEKIVFHFNNDNSGSTIALRNRILNDDLDSYIIFTLTMGGALDSLRTQPLMFNKIATFFPVFFRLIYYWIATSLITIMFIRRKQLFNNILSAPSMLLIAILAPYDKRHALHLHEFKVNNKWLNKVVITSLKLTRSNYIFVSNYQKQYFCQNYGLSGKVVLNVLDPIFRELSPKLRTSPYSKRNRITFVGSDSLYKGLSTFIELKNQVKLSKDVVWTIVTPKILENMVQSKFDVHSNPQRERLAEIYSESLVVMNLSKSNMWIETFGMTIFEGSAFGALSITPNIGGFLDYVRREWSLSLDTSAPTEDQLEDIKEILLVCLDEDNWTRRHKKMLADCESIPELKTILEK